MLLTAAAISQWTYETNLPNDSTHVPLIWQVRVIDSSVSFVFGTVHINENQDYPYFAKRNTSGWQYVNTDLNLSVRGYSFTAIDSLNIWLGSVHPDNIYYSSNGGMNWILQKHVADTGHIVGLEFSKQHPNIGYALATLAFNGFWNGARILKTTNYGLNWSSWDFEFYAYAAEDNSICVIDSNYAWFGASNVLGGPGKIIMTSNGGLNWNVTDINAGYFSPFTIQFSDDKKTGLFVGETPPTSWFYRTTNSGQNWNIVYTTTNYYSKTMRWIPGTTNVYGNSEFVIVRSINNGFTWSTMTGAPNSNLISIDAVRINEGTIYALAVTSNRSVYKLIDTARVIAIENSEIIIPVVFNLYQNYPNPFNPVTTIKYDIPKTSNVTIVVYDLLGREVTRLINNELKNSGRYAINWNANNYASGVYIYRIKAGDYISVKKMVLVK